MQRPFVFWNGTAPPLQTCRVLASRDGSHVLTGDLSGVVTVWQADPEDNAEFRLRSMLLGLKGKIRDIVDCMIDTDPGFCVLTSGGALALCTLADCRCVRFQDGCADPQSANCLLPLPGFGYVAVASAGSNIDIVDLQGLSSFCQLKPPQVAIGMPPSLIPPPEVPETDYMFVSLAGENGTYSVCYWNGAAFLNAPVVLENVLPLTTVTGKTEGVAVSCDQTSNCEVVLIVCTHNWMLYFFREEKPFFVEHAQEGETFTEGRFFNIDRFFVALGNGCVKVYSLNQEVVDIAKLHRTTAAPPAPAGATPNFSVTTPREHDNSISPRGHPSDSLTVQPNSPRAPVSPRGPPISPDAAKKKSRFGFGTIGKGISNLGSAIKSVSGGRGSHHLQQHSSHTHTGPVGRGQLIIKLENITLPPTNAALKSVAAGWQEDNKPVLLQELKGDDSSTYSYSSSNTGSECCLIRATPICIERWVADQDALFELVSVKNFADSWEVTHHSEFAEVTCSVLATPFHGTIHGCVDGTVIANSCAYGRKVWQGHQSKITAMHVVHETVITGAADGTVSVWSLKDNQLRHSFQHHTSAVTDFIELPDILQERLNCECCSVGKDGCIIFYDVTEHATLLPIILSGHERVIIGLYWVVDMDYVLVDTENEMFIWHLSSGFLERRITDEADRKAYIAFSNCYNPLKREVLPPPPSVALLPTGYVPSHVAQKPYAWMKAAACLRLVPEKPEVPLLLIDIHGLILEIHKEAEKFVKGEEVEKREPRKKPTSGHTPNSPTSLFSSSPTLLSFSRGGHNPLAGVEANQPQQNKEKKDDKAEPDSGSKYLAIKPQQQAAAASDDFDAAMVDEEIISPVLKQYPLSEPLLNALSYIFEVDSHHSIDQLRKKFHLTKDLVPPPTIGATGPGRTVALLSPTVSGEKTYTVSPSLTAFRSITAVSVIRAMLAFDPNLRNTIKSCIHYYLHYLPNTINNYAAPSVVKCAEELANVNPDIRYAARACMLSVLSKLSSPELHELATHYKNTIGRVPLKYPTEVVALCVICLHHKVNESVIGAAANSLKTVVCNGGAMHSCAIKMLGENFPLWSERIGDVSALIKDLFYYSYGEPTIGSAFQKPEDEIGQAAVHTLSEIGNSHTLQLLKFLEGNFVKQRPSQHQPASLHVLWYIADNNPVGLAQCMLQVTDLIVKAADGHFPNIRDSCWKVIRPLIRMMVPKYPMVDFNSEEQRLIGGDHTGQITIYDLRTGKLVFTYKACDTPVSCLKFSPKAEMFALYSNTTGTVQVFSYNVLTLTQGMKRVLTTQVKKNQLMDVPNILKHASLQWQTEKKKYKLYLNGCVQGEPKALVWTCSADPNMDVCC